MGIDLFDSVGFRIVSKPVQSVGCKSLSTVTLDKYPQLLKPSGLIKGYQHKPLLVDNPKWVREPLRKLPLSMREPVSQELKRMEAEGIIERTDASPCISNIVVAQKKTGGVRVCIDIRNANKNIIPGSQPLPTFDELSSDLTGSCIFSKLDLKWGYLQLKLAEESRYMTTFTSDFGVFRFCRLSFGLSSGPAAYQKVIAAILEGINGVFNFFR